MTLALSPNVRLGEQLLRDGLVTPEQLAQALARQQSSGVRIGRALVEIGAISAATLVQALSTRLGVPGTVLRHGLIDPKVARLLPKEEAERLKVETEKALAAYEQELAAARGRAGTIARETREKLAGEVDVERTRVDNQVNAKLADAEKRIFDMKSKALAQVNDIASETAGAVVAKLIGTEVSADEARRALEPVAGE